MNRIKGPAPGREGVRDLWSLFFFVVVVGIAGCGGGGGGGAHDPDNPIPSLSSISPSGASAGRSGFTLTVQGSNFISGSVVRWNGSNRATTFVSATQLTASIPASDIAAPGAAQVTVFNPAPGGGVSGALSFTVTNPTGVISRLSVAPDGTTLGNDSSGDAVPSRNGRFVAFASEARNLVPGGTNSFTQIFVRDTCLGATGCTPSTALVSVADDGTTQGANGRSENPTISTDGRFVGFESFATNLVPGQTDPVQRIFVRDTCAGASGCTPSTVLVSVAHDGGQPNGSSYDASLGDTGRFVAFASDATNLVTTQMNPVRHIFIRDTCLGATGCTPSTTRASVAGNGVEGNNSSFDPSISATGRFLAFESDASNLVAGDTNGATDIFVRDTCLGATGCTPSTIRVSVATDGTQSNGPSRDGLINATGRFVTFESDATNLVTGDTNGVTDIFVHDTCLGATGCTPSTIRVSVATDGTQGNGGSFDPAISGDGRLVTFESDASNLVTGDTNGATDIFVRDTCVGATGCTPSTIRVSVASDGSEADGASFDPTISADGHVVVFQSLATNLVPGGNNGKSHILLALTGQ